MTFEEMQVWRLILERLSPGQKRALLVALLKLQANEDRAAIPRAIQR
jgi:hypothetical protein